MLDGNLQVNQFINLSSFYQASFSSSLIQPFNRSTWVEFILSTVIFESSSFYQPSFSSSLNSSTRIHFHSFIFNRSFFNRSTRFEFIFIRSFYSFILLVHFTRSFSIHLYFILLIFLFRNFSSKYNLMITSFSLVHFYSFIFTHSFLPNNL